MGNQPAQLFCVWMIFLGSIACFAGETHTDKATQKNIPLSVKVDLAPGDQLSPQEIKQVVALAKQHGITNAGVISTSYSLPGGRKEGISVQSVQRVDGRNTQYETLGIRKNGWGDVKRPASAKHIGNFWVDANEQLWPTLLRSYQWTNQQPFQVSIGKDVPIPIADKLVNLLITDKLPFSEKRKEPEVAGVVYLESYPGKPNDLRPIYIYKGDSINKRDLKNCYKVEFQRRCVFEYKFEKGEFIYIGSYEYEI